VNEIAPGSAVLHIEFQERRSRLSFLQPLLGYPQLIVMSVVALPLLLADLVAWLALIITGRDPAFHHRWLSSWLPVAIRVWAYINLIVGTYPGWRLNDKARSPALLVIGPPKPNYSRIKALFRIVYIIPAYIGAVVSGLIGYALLVVSAIWILITGRQPRGIFEIQCRCLRWYSLCGLLVNLVTEDYTLPLD
jgi:hypothetical protein